MVMAAKSRGLKHIAVTEHSKHLTVAHGLDEKRLLKQIDAIDRRNETLKGITVLKGIELDNLDDGRQDLAGAVLGRLDLVISAVDSQFNLSRE